MFSAKENNFLKGRLTEWLINLKAHYHIKMHRTMGDEGLANGLQKNIGYLINATSKNLLNMFNALNAL